VHPDFQTARDLLQRAVADKVFPAAVAEVGTSRQQLWRESFGRLSYAVDAPLTQPDTIFDLASLTKVLSTTPLVMRMVERGGLAHDDSVAAHLPLWAMRRDPAAVTIRDLLSHCSGLPAYAALFRDLGGHMAFEQAICGMAFEYPPRSASVYSDLGFILLGLILERVAPLWVQFDTLMQQMGGLQELQFHPPKAWRRRIAPTRNDDWRGRMLVGEVDDNNAWALGGAAGHAGLFGTAGAVGECARHLLQILGGRRGVFREETLRAFVTRRADIAGSSRALGWDTMLTTSSCGTRMSARAFGHTGFTGTSLWIDPAADVYVVLLTNRVHPNAVDDTHIRAVRREVHDAVMSVIVGGSGA
jgi:CubicO group peptidase (beta-lactamase class C family)